MSLRRAQVFGPSLPSHLEDTRSAVPTTEDEIRIPEISLGETSSQAEYFEWADQLNQNMLHKAGMGLAHSCIIPQRQLVDAIKDCLRLVGLSKVTSIGSGQALLEWLLAEDTPCICVDTCSDESWLIPPARVHQNLHFSEPEVPIQQDSLMLFCWGLLPKDAARLYVQQICKDTGRSRAIVVIADDTCCPTAADIHSWLHEGSTERDTNDAPRWQCIREEPAQTLGPPCTLTVFLALAV